MLAPVTTMSVRDLALQLGTGAFPEWLDYDGHEVIGLPIDRLIESDPNFYVFWGRRLREEAVAFDRVLEEGSDFLDFSVARFFASPEHDESTLHRVLPTADETVRSWAQRRRERVAERITYHERRLP